MVDPAFFCNFVRTSNKTVLYDPFNFDVCELQKLKVILWLFCWFFTFVICWQQLYYLLVNRHVLLWLLLWNWVVNCCLELLLHQQLQYKITCNLDTPSQTRIPGNCLFCKRRRNNDMITRLATQWNTPSPLYMLLSTKQKTFTSLLYHRECRQYLCGSLQLLQEQYYFLLIATTLSSVSFYEGKDAPLNSRVWSEENPKLLQLLAKLTYAWGEIYM